MNTDRMAIEREFEILMAKNGIVIPPDRRAGVLAGYEELRRLTTLLRTQRTAASEPSNVFVLNAILRSP